MKPSTEILYIVFSLFFLPSAFAVGNTPATCISVLAEATPLVPADINHPHDGGQKVPDCVSAEPGPGNPCYCFYNGHEFKCLKREGRPGNNCTYHRDCALGQRVANEQQPIPTYGPLVPSFIYAEQ